MDLVTEPPVRIRKVWLQSVAKAVSGHIEPDPSGVAVGVLNGFDGIETDDGIAPETYA